MARLSLITALFFCLYTYAKGAGVKDKILELAGCPADGDVGPCLDKQLSKFLQESLVFASGFVGGSLDKPFNLPKIKTKYGTISGSEITLDGLKTLKISDIKLSGNTLGTGVSLEKLYLDGDFTIALKNFGTHKVHLNIDIRQLTADASLVVFIEDGKLQVKDVSLDLKVGYLKVELNKGEPLLKNHPFAGLVNSLAKTWLKKINDQASLNEVIIPLLTEKLEEEITTSLNRCLKSDKCIKH